jgi:hypothetical protein
MANKTVIVRLEVDDSQAVRAVKGLDKQIEAVGRDAKKSASNIDSLGDSIQEMSDTATFGLEEVTQQIGVGGESAKKFGESIVSAFKSAKLGAAQFKTALVSLGIGALMIAIDLIIQNWDKIIGFFDGSAKAAKAFADQMDRVNTSLQFIAVSEALAANKIDKLNRVINDGNKSYKERADAIKAVQTEEALLNAERSSAIAQEQEAIAQRLEYTTSEEERLELTKRGQQLAIELIKLEGERDKIANRATDSQKSLEQSEIARLTAQRAAAQAQAKADFEALQKRNAENTTIDLANKGIAKEAEVLQIVKFDNKLQEHKDRLAQHDKMREEQLQAELTELRTQGVDAALALTELFSGTNDKMAKKAFDVAKALGIAQATISGIEAVQNAYKTAQGSPITAIFPGYPIVQAGLAAVFAAAKVKSIASQQFSPSGGTGASGISVGGGGGGGGATVPNVSVVGGGINATGQLAQNFNDFAQRPARAYVVGQDITTQQQLDRRIRTNATFG